MQKKTLSISIAAYNVEKYLDKTLASLCVPSIVEELEVLVVNDGSTDGTAEIARRYCNMYPESFILIDKENGGYGSTINSSLEVATGKYFKLLDGDDWFDSNSLTVFVDRLRDCSADIVYTNFTSIQESSMNEDLTSFNWKGDVLFNAEDVDVLSMHGSTVRTHVLQQGMVRITEHCFYTDVEYSLKALALCRTAEYFPINVYCYRLGVQGQSVSLKGMIRHIDDHERISKMALDMVHSNKKLRKVKPTIDFMAQRHVNLLILLGDCERYRNYVSFLRKEYPDVKTWEKAYQWFVSVFPSVFFRPVSNIKRRKNNL